MISAIQSRRRTKRILIGKTDLNAAYRRIHINDTTVPTCISIVDELAFICLRLTFGTTPAPAEYTTISKAEIYLGNNQLRYESWDTTDIKSPHSNLIPEEDKCHSADHLSKLYPLAVNIKAKEAYLDFFI